MSDIFSVTSAWVLAALIFSCTLSVREFVKLLRFLWEKLNGFHVSRISVRH